MQPVPLNDVTLKRAASGPESAGFTAIAAPRFDTVTTRLRVLLLFDPQRNVQAVGDWGLSPAECTEVGRSGAEVILRVKGTGEVLGGLGVPGGPHFLTAQTLEPCVVLVWEARKFELLEDRFPALRRNTVRIFAERLRILEQMFLELATEQVAPRLARMLVRLLEQNALNQEHAVRIDLSREELAQMTGTTLFTVSRILCDWEQRGIIQTQRKAVLVQDLRSLVALADGIHDTV